MHERDAFLFWKDKGLTGNQLVDQLNANLQAFPKANKQRRRELLALSTSLLKAICYELGIKWAHMGLHEHRYVKEIPEPMGIKRAPPPAPKPDPKPEPIPDTKQLMRLKKEELAKKVKDLQDELNEISEIEEEP